MLEVAELGEVVLALGEQKEEPDSSLDFEPMVHKKQQEKEPLSISQKCPKLHASLHCTEFLFLISLTRMGVLEA